MTTIQEEIRTCTKCEKRYVLSKGFGKTNGYYRNVCKRCRGDQESDRKAKIPRTFQKHLFREGNKCVRCGIKRKLKAHFRIQNRWLTEYLVNGEWTMDKPVCKVE